MCKALDYALRDPQFVNILLQDVRRPRLSLVRLYTTPPGACAGRLVAALSLPAWCKFKRMRINSSYLIAICNGVLTAWSLTGTTMRHLNDIRLTWVILSLGSLIVHCKFNAWRATAVLLCAGLLWSTETQSSVGVGKMIPIALLMMKATIPVSHGVVLLQSTPLGGI